MRGANGVVDNLMRRIVFEPGHQIFQEGGFGDVAYVVVTGEVEIARQVKGQRKVLGIIRSGACSAKWIDRWQAADG